VQAIREHARLAPTVGWAPIGRCKVPATSSEADLAAAKQATFAVTSKDYWNNAWLADPVLFGRYPEDGLKLYHDDLQEAGDGKAAWTSLHDAADLRTINQKLDFYGLNIYDAERVRMGDAGPEKVDFPPGHPQNALRWFVEPDSLYYGPKWLYERYQTPICITENGMTNLDWVGVDGEVHDPQRIDYTRRYLRSLRRAIADGADIRAYFHWSIMDNFEWQCGYRERFGLIHVDYQTGKRTLKDSARWYREVIATRGANL
jgi:beta-glucosidase